MRVCLWLLMSSIYTISLHGNALLKLFHHKGLNADKLVLYTRKPVKIQQSSDRKDGKQYLVFLLPSVIVSNKMGSAVDTVNTQKHDDYELAIKQNLNGLQISLNYDPVKTDYTVETFHAIATQFGIMLTIVQKGTSLTTKRKGVVLDFGHGGDDHGAIGCNGVTEKIVTHAVGQKVKRLLEQNGIPVYLTRTKDQTVPLNKRTQFANAKNASLFVSIHANAAANKNAQGIETFCAHPKLLSCTAGACNAENAKRAHANGLNGCFLAQSVHTTVLNNVRSVNPGVKDRKLKHAVSQVLAGTQIPATLIELGFVSNCAEAAKLNDSRYQMKLAEGIVEGILKYLRDKDN